MSITELHDSSVIRSLVHRLSLEYHQTGLLGLTDEYLLAFSLNVDKSPAKLTQALADVATSRNRITLQEHQKQPYLDLIREYVDQL